MQPAPTTLHSRLGDAAPRFRGRIVALATGTTKSAIAPEELERRLLEMGFVEGAQVELRHQGLFRADPIAVQVDGTLVALRRREAQAIVVTALD